MITYEKPGVVGPDGSPLGAPGISAADSRFFTLSATPVAVWKLDEPSGSSGSDSLGTLAMAHQAGATAGVAAKISKGVSYNGAANGFSTAGGGGPVNFERTDPFSIVFWMKYAVGGLKGVMFSRSDGPGTRRGWLCGMLGGGSTGFYFHLVSSWSSNAIATDAVSATIDDGSPHHVVATYDGSSSAAGVSFYVDGATTGRTVVIDTLSTTIQNAAAETVIGAYGKAGNYAAPCELDYMDDVAIFAAKLTAADVTTIYNKAQEGVSVAFGRAG